MKLQLQKNLSLANRLVSALPAAERAGFLEACELVELKLHASVVKAGEPAEHAYFPVDCFVSAMLPALAAPSVEVGLVGSEGMFSTSAVLGLSVPAFTFRVQGAGRAFRISCSELQRRLEEDCCLRGILHRYLGARERQLAQQLACISHHGAEQRFARLLLAMRDRAHCSELFMTHETQALMLGVRRETISRVAGSFQDRQLISYSRGYLLLLDEPGLEHIACSCYGYDLMAYDEALSAQPAAQACQTAKPASRSAMPSSTSISRAPS